MVSEIGLKMKKPYRGWYLKNIGPFLYWAQYCILKRTNNKYVTINLISTLAGCSAEEC